jgi:hypothetical protein
MGGLDYSYEWTAPAAGRYVFTTNSPTTTFDTVLYLLDGTCDGDELACREDVPENTRSTVVVELAMGQTVIVVVDAYGVANGAYELRIFDAPAEDTAGGSCCDGGTGEAGCDIPSVQDCACAYDNACCNTEWDDDCVASAILGCAAMCDEAACVTESLDSDLGDNLASGTNLGAGDDLDASCDGSGGEEVTYSWTAPSTGLFELSTLASDFDTALSVGAPSCLITDELICADDVGGDTALVFAESGQELYISIEGYNGAIGDYQLDINAYDPDLTCAIEGDLGMATGDNLAMGGTAALADDYDASCGGSTAPDAIYTWTSPAAGDYTFSLAGGTDYDAVLALSFGCELNDATCSDTVAPEEFTVTLAAGVELLIVIDGYNGATGNYTLSIDPA